MFITATRASYPIVMLAIRPDGLFDPLDVGWHLGVHPGRFLVATKFSKRRYPEQRQLVRIVFVFYLQRAAGITLKKQKVFECRNYIIVYRSIFFLFYSFH